MTPFLRVIILVCALGMAIYVFRKIRRSNIRVGEALYWFFFCIVLLVTGVFPEVVFWATRFLEIESPINFVFLYIIFFLIIKVFTLSLHVSAVEEKQRTMAQEIALRNMPESKAASGEAGGVEAMPVKKAENPQSKQSENSTKNGKKA